MAGRDKPKQDLIECMHSNNLLTRPVGINWKRKLGARLDSRVYVLLGALWLDTLYTSLLALIPTEQEKLLLVLGDFAFLYFDKMRYFFFAVPLFYRISSASMVALFIYKDFGWIEQANRIFNRLKSQALCERIARLRKRCQTVALVVTLGRASLILLILGFTIKFMRKIRERNSKYTLWPTYAYLFGYAFVYTGINVQFMLELYLLCRICTEIFKEINAKFHYEIARHRMYSGFGIYNANFSMGALFVHRVMSYVKPIYIIYASANLVVTIFIMYVGLFVSSNPYVQTGYFAFISVEIAIVIFFSQVIGHIDVKAKQLSDDIYLGYIINVHNRFTKSLKAKIHRYLQTVWSTNLSLVILGNPINSSTCIKVLTIVLTVIAFLISNFRDM